MVREPVLGVVGQQPQDHLQAAAAGASTGGSPRVRVDAAGGVLPAGTGLRAAAAAATAARARVNVSGSPGCGRSWPRG